jgi:hypothetical protein
MTHRFAHNDSVGQSPKQITLPSLQTGMNHPSFLWYLSFREVRSTCSARRPDTDSTADQISELEEPAVSRAIVSPLRVRPHAPPRIRIETSAPRPLPGTQPIRIHRHWPRPNRTTPDEWDPPRSDQEQNTILSAMIFRARFSGQLPLSVSSTFFSVPSDPAGKSGTAAHRPAA